jgi:magnesium-protoporphyrin O-methyltransferase
MDACGCDGFASIFDEATAEGDRRRYAKNGPDKTTRMLLDMVRPYNAPGATVLDIGGGIGIIDQELLREGAGRAVLVDGSQAYLDVARQEARRLNLLERMELVRGDFVAEADRIDAADIVTLDRVVCCYPGVRDLVARSSARARRVYALVLPRDRWWLRPAAALLNLGFRLRRKPYRTYMHPNREVDRIVAANGLSRRAEATTFLWRVVAYDRASS